MSKYARRAGKRDTIEPAVIDVALRNHWDVLQMDAFDLLCHRRGVILVVEVKTGDKPLTAHQKKLQQAGWPLVVVRSIQDAEGVFA